MLWNALERSGTLWGALGTLWGRPGALWGRSGTLWGAPGALWDSLGHLGMLWDDAGGGGDDDDRLSFLYIYKLPINRLRGRYVNILFQGT